MSESANDKSYNVHIHVRQIKVISPKHFGFFGHLQGYHLKLQETALKMAEKVETFGIFTNCIDENSSWESNIFKTIQEAPGIPWKSKVHYRVNKSPPLILTLTQINQVQPLQADFRKMHCNIILTSTFRSSKVMSASAYKINIIILSTESCRFQAASYWLLNATKFVLTWHK